MATNASSVSFVLEPKCHATPLLDLPPVSVWRPVHKPKKQEQRRWIKCDISDNLMGFWSPMKTESLNENYLFFISHTVASQFLMNSVIFEQRVIQSSFNSLVIKNSHLFLYFKKVTFSTSKCFHCLLAPQAQLNTWLITEKRLCIGCTM